jgi:PAS domain S-box-containing protein
VHILKGKTNLLFFLAPLALVILFWLPFRESRRLLETEREVGRTHEVLQTSADLREHLAGSVAARRGYLLYGDAKLFDVFAQESHEALESYAALRRLSAENPEQQKRLQELESSLQSRLILLKQSVELHQKGGDDREAQGNLREQGVPLEEEIQKDLRQFEDVERAQLAQRTVTAASAVRLSNWLSIGLTIGVLTVLALALWIINREHAARARAERALAGNEKLVESVLNTISDEILVSDLSGRVILRNAAAMRLQPHQTADLTSREERPQVFGLYQPDQTTLYSAEQLPLARTLRGEIVDNVEIYVRASGEKEGQWLLAAGRPLRDAEGQIQGGVIFLRDVTERKQVEHALAEKERLLHSVVNSAGEGIIVADRSGKVILSNAAANRFHDGAPRQEIGLQELPQTLGLYLPDKITLYPVEDLPLARAIRGESVDDAEVFVRTAVHPEGRWLLVTSRPRRDEKGEHQGGVVVFRDITERKKVLAELQEGEARLAYAQGIAHVGSWEWNLESNEQYWSDEIYRICGLAPQQVGASVEEFMKLVHPEDRELVKKSVREALEGKKRYDIEHRILRRDGQERIVHEQGEVFRDPAGKAVRTAGVVQDITERKQAEQRLAAHDRMLQLILNSIGDGIMVADASRKTVLMNPVVARMYKSVPEGTPPEDLPRVMGLYQPDMTTLYQIDELPLHQAIRGESVDGVEIYIQAPGEKEGRWLLSSGRPLLDENGRSHGGVVSVRDITDRRKALAALQESEARLEEAQRIAHFGNWDWNVVTNELWWSDETYRIFGLQPQQFGATYDVFLDSVHPAEREVVDHAMQEAFQGKKPYSFDHRIVLPDGSERIVHEQAEVFRDAAGKVVRMAGVVQDITERKRAEEELRKANERVGQILESISDSFIGLDKDFRFTYVNAHAANVLQRPAAELLGKDLWKEFPEARGTPLESVCRRVLEKGVPVHIQNFYEPLGKWFDVYAYPAPDGLSLFYSDITESKEAEEKIRKADERTRQILESITDAFMAWDNEDRIVYINENGARLLKHTREELLGKNAWEMFPGVIGTLFEAETKRALRERTAVHYEEYFPPIDAWLETHMYPSAEGLSVFFRDVTARRQAQAERENLLNELSEALANVKKLSGMLPICSACKKVRDDSGYWSQIEDYVRKHSEAQFSHGICPDCMRSLYPDMAAQVESKLKKLEEDKKKS